MTAYLCKICCYLLPGISRHYVRLCINPSAPQLHCALLHVFEFRHHTKTSRLISRVFYFQVNVTKASCVQMRAIWTRPANAGASRASMDASVKISSNLPTMLVSCAVEIPLRSQTVSSRTMFLNIAMFILLHSQSKCTVHAPVFNAFSKAFKLSY